MEKPNTSNHINTVQLDPETLYISLVSQLYADPTLAESLIHEFREDLRQFISNVDSAKSVIRMMYAICRFLESLEVYTDEQLEEVIHQLLGTPHMCDALFKAATYGFLRDLQKQGGGDMGHLNENLVYYYDLLEEQFDEEEPIDEQIRGFEEVREAISTILQKNGTDN